MKPPKTGAGWAMVPLLTAGIGSPVSFLYAAVRHRSPALGLAGAGYGAGMFVAFAGFGSGGAGGALGLLMFILTWVASTVHAFAARPRLYPATPPPEQMNQQVVAMARHRRSLREAARKIVADDPVLARELRIGRPELMPRQFDDGGLIDVNHVPPEVVSRLPGLTYAMVDHIVRVRGEGGAFISVEELVVRCDLPPTVISEISEYALFVP